jgi:hypothetical protein
MDDVVTSSRRMTTPWAQGRHGSTASRAWEQCRVHSVVGSGRTMLLRAQELRCGLRDGACVVDGVTGSGEDGGV